MRNWILAIITAVVAQPLATLAATTGETITYNIGGQAYEGYYV
jgi:hypothetical protein